MTVAVNKVDRLSRAETLHRRSQQAAELRRQRGHLSHLGAYRGRRAGARRAPPRADAAGALHVRPRHDLRPAAGGGAGRAGARGGHQAHLPGGAARGRRDRRGGRTTPRGPRKGTGADLGGERIPEGDTGRRRRTHDQGDRDCRAARGSSASSAVRSTSTCPCASAATGGPTRGCSTAWA